MNDEEKNIELTAEDIEGVTGGVKSLSDLIFAGAEFIPRGLYVLSAMQVPG